MGHQSYVLIEATHYTKCLDQFLGSFACDLSQQGKFLLDDQNKEQQPYPYVLIKTTHYPKYLDQFLMVSHATFTTGLIL